VFERVLSGGRSGAKSVFEGQARQVDQDVDSS
jgi:hypothetical protein